MPLPEPRERVFCDPKLDRLPQINPYLKKMMNSRTQSDPNVLFGRDLIDIKFHWLEHFRNRHKNTHSEGCNKTRPIAKRIVVEIGMHKGLLLTEIAKRHVDTGFVGMDITYKRVMLSSQRAQLQDLDNITLVHGNAKFLSEVFGTGEVAGIIMFFPDPWSKKTRQRNYRSIDDSLCDSIQLVLENHGFFWLKTDDHDYFADVTKMLEKRNFDRIPIPPEWVTTPKSLFEQKFAQAGTATFSAFWVKSFPAEKHDDCATI